MTPIEQVAKAEQPPRTNGWQLALGSTLSAHASFALGLLLSLCLLLTGCERKQKSPAPKRPAPSSTRSLESSVAGNHAASSSGTNVGAGSSSPSLAPAPKTPQASGLPLYELKMDPKELRALERNPGSDQTHPATFFAGGETYEGVQVRFRGEWARSWPKKPLKIFFSRTKPYQGHHSVNLNSAWRDAAFVRETLAYQVYAACGVPASRSRLVRLHVNGQFRGVYVEVEQVDKTLLGRFNLKGAGLFKATSDDNQGDERDHGSEAAFARHYENETSKDEGLGDLQRFCHELATTSNALDFFNRRVDIDKYINYLAATVLIQHWDCFNKNHFMVYDRKGSGKWFALPWDLDRTFGDHWNGSFDSANLALLLGTRRLPGVTGWNRLQDRFFSEPTLRARFLERLAELLQKEFATEKLFPLLDQLEAEIGADAALDRRRWPGPEEDLHEGIVGVKHYIERRRAWLLREIQRLR